MAGDQRPVKRRGEEDNAETLSAQRKRRREKKNKTPGAKPAPGAPDEERRKRAAYPLREALRVKSRPLFLGFGVVGVGFYFFDLVGVALAVGGD